MGCDVIDHDTPVRIVVSIHAPTWGATTDANPCHKTLWFQSTHPHGVRHIRYMVKWNIVRVSIHAPTWGATKRVNLITEETGFQSTHPHGVRPRPHIGWFGSLVSIHAPTWGATAAAHIPVDLGQVSIHAPTWGATVIPVVRTAFHFVSIHAPTWGATHGSRMRCARTPCFNPRTHMGCDRKILKAPDSPPCFNPRTHMGCDSNAGFLMPSRQEFQSTHPHGVRPKTAMGIVIDVPVSIHAPTWGATKYNPKYQRCIGVSIHAPTWGATGIIARRTDLGSFNPRTHMGCDSYSANI